MRAAIASICACLLVAATAVAAEKPSPYLDDQGQLKAAISLRNAQGGFVGFTGQLYTIEPNGEWTVQRFVNQKVDEPSRKGKLPKGQLAELAQSLAKEDFAGLPQQIGKRQGANPHLYTVTFGKQSVVLILGAGAPLPTPEADRGKPDATARMVGVVRTIEKLLGEPKKE
jgi:hypothetical protein